MKEHLVVLTERIRPIIERNPYQGIKALMQGVYEHEVLNAHPVLVTRVERFVAEFEVKTGEHWELVEVAIDFLKELQ